MKLILAIVGLFLIFGCETTGVKKKENVEIVQDSQAKTEDLKENVLDKPSIAIEEEKLDNGIIIKWIEHGTGESISKGDMVQIDYKVFLKNNTVVDGNHLLNKESMPFMIGFQMQTIGWDIALEKLKVGDFAEIFIPSELARGEKGIEGLIPPNSDNILKIRILEKTKPSREIDGNKVWVFEENEKSELAFSENEEIEFHCMVSTPTKPLYINTYRSGEAFKLRLQDSGTVPGLKKALINAKKSDRMFVLVPSSEAYAGKGYLDIVKPNQDLFYNIMVMDVTKQ